jgi:trimethylamine:corrinoid methyltransferase-like protein
VTVDVLLFTELGAPEQEALQVVIERFGRFLGLPTRLVLSTADAQPSRQG